MKVKSLSRIRLLATPWTAAYQAPPSMDFPGKSTEWGAIAFSWILSVGHSKSVIPNMAGTFETPEWSAL